MRLLNEILCGETVENYDAPNEIICQIADAYHWVRKRYNLRDYFAVAFLYRNTVTETETAALTNSLKGYDSAIDFYLDEARSVIEITAQGKQVIDYSFARKTAPLYTSGEGASEADVHKVAQSILKNSRLFEYLVLLSADGIVLQLDPHQLQREMSRTNLAFTNWYKKLIKTGQTVTSDLHISPATQRPTVIIATPVQRCQWQDRRNMGWRD